jgi:hypothetical protein
MTFRTVILLLASAMGGGLSGMAQPPEGPEPPQAELQLAGISPAEAGDQPLMAPDQTPMWGRGQFLPPEFRAEEFKDWEAYHLAPPTDGYHWVRVARGAYRVKQENGFIAEAVFGLPAN